MMTRKQRHERRANEYKNKKGIKGTRPISIETIERLQKVDIPKYFVQGTSQTSLSPTTFFKLTSASWLKVLIMSKAARTIIGINDNDQFEIGPRTVYKPGPRVMVNILSGMNCHIVGRDDNKKRHRFGIYNEETYTVDHVIDIRKLCWAYLEGIIEKDQIHNVEHLLLARREKNIKKGSTSYMDKIKRRKAAIESELKKADEIMSELKIWAGCETIEIRRLDKNGLPFKDPRKATTKVLCMMDPEFAAIMKIEDLPVQTRVKLAYWYKSHELLNTKFYQENQADSSVLGFASGMIMKYHT